MMTWMRFAMSFFVLCLVLFGFMYFFSPGSRESFANPNSPVGQLPADHHETTPGQPEPATK